MSENIKEKIKQNKETSIIELKNKWPYLPKSFGKILKYLILEQKNSGKLSPCINTIAKKTKFSRSTTKRAIKFYENIGIMYHLKRAYNSNIYFLNNELLEIDFKNPKWWLN